MKTCSCCGEDKEDSDFRKRKYKNGKEYLYSKCKSCEREALYAYRKAKPEVYRAISRKSYLKKVVELSRQSPLSSDPEITKEKKRISNLKWQKANPDKVKTARLLQKLNGNDAAKAARRRALKKNATPVWADLDLIKEAYQEAQYHGMHVDHIIPLKGKTVCGLHVWDNLQLLDPIENIKKSNKFTWED